MAASTRIPALARGKVSERAKQTLDLVSRTSYTSGWTDTESVQG